jgi:hypothetical protein
MRDTIVTQAVRSGRAIPARFLEPPPEVQLGLGIYMKGFFDLACDRHDGGRISWSTVRDWCDARGLVGDDADDAWFLLSRMDIAYLTWVRSKTKKPGKKPTDDEAQDGIPSGVR